MIVGKKPYYGWWVLASAITVLTNGFALSAFALPVFYPEFVQSFDWNRANVALGGSLKTLLVGLVAPLNGWFIDRRGVKAMIVAGLGTLALCWVLLSQVSLLWQYFVVCLLLGIGGSWTHYLPAQLLVANWFVKKRGLVMGILNGGAGFGQAFIALLSGALIESVGWSKASLLLPLVLILPLLAVLFVVKNKPQDIGLNPDGPAGKPDPAATTASLPNRGNDTTQGKAVFRTVQYWMLATILLLSAWAAFSVWQHFVLFFRDKGFEPTVAASLFSMFLATSTVGCLVSGPLCDRISAQSTILLSFVCIAVAIAALPFTRGYEAALACVVLYGLGYGGTVTVRPLLIFELFGSTAAGRLYGVATAMFTTGAFIGPILAGYIHDTTTSYDIAYLLALALICVSMVLVRALRWIGNSAATLDRH